MRCDRQQQVRVHIRWISRLDRPAVLAIAADSFENPWTEKHLICCLFQPNNTCMVAEYKERVVGFMIYELNETHIQVLSFATAADFRRRGVGSQMMSKLIRKLSAGWRTRIDLEVHENYLPAQLFFQSVGFRAVSIIREYYLMRYRYRPEIGEFVLRSNRIAGLCPGRPG